MPDQQISGGLLSGNLVDNFLTAKMNNDSRILNFPIQLLQDAPNMESVCCNIVDYATFSHGRNLNGTGLHKMKSAAKFLGIKLGSPENSMVNGMRLHEKIPLKSPMSGISVKVLFEFLHGSPSNEEIAYLAAHLALKSIVGKKSYSRVTKEFLLCRMAGFVSPKDMPELPEYLKKYFLRWHFDKLKCELTDRYGWLTYGRYTRGFFVSRELTLKKLIKNVEMKRQKFRKEQQKKAQAAALSEVLKELENSPTP